MPFQEIPHTADLCVRVSAADIPSLFREAARGMYALSGLEISPGLEIRYLFTSTAPDLETHLVSFLSELLYKIEQENACFNSFKIVFQGDKLKVKMKGAPIHSVKRIIKAVTFHNLKIQQEGDHLVVDIIFDV